MLTDNLMRGGKERRLIELLKFFDNIEGITISLVIFKNLIEYPEVNKLKNTSLIVFERRTKKDFSIFFKLFRHSEKFNPDILHSWGSQTSVYALPIVILKKVPFINAMITHSKVLRFSENWIRAKITFPFSTKIVANSIAGLKAYNVLTRKGLVVYNGFDFHRIDFLNPIKTIKNKYNIRTKFIIGMIAGFFERKDYRTYLEGARILSQRRNDITFLAIGDGIELNYYKEEYSKYENIVFTGNVDKVEEIINVLDIGVLLTNPQIHGEGISNAILEMMAMEKPVIATDGGGTNEIIINTSLGILLPPISTNDFIKAVEMLLEDEIQRKKIGVRARQRVIDVFSINKMGTRTLELYKELIMKE